MKLIDTLRNFKGAASIEELSTLFSDLAPAIIYGGYIKVGEDYHIYIHTVEFYFHSETGSPYDIQDPIVYHREGKYEGRRVPYFPVLSLHAHASGYDITFENGDLKYRASALIRAYSIYDVKEKRFLDTQKEGRHWDDRSTYLYDFINGFPIDGNRFIEWIDAEQTCPHEVKEPTPRRNVFTYENGKKTDKKICAHGASLERKTSLYDLHIQISTTCCNGRCCCHNKRRSARCF